MSKDNFIQMLILSNISNTSLLMELQINVLNTVMWCGIISHCYTQKLGIKNPLSFSLSQACAHVIHIHNVHLQCTMFITCF